MTNKSTVSLFILQKLEGLILTLITRHTAITPTGTEQWRVTVTTFTRALSVWVSTLETALDMETLMAQQAGCQCPA